MTPQDHTTERHPDVTAWLKHLEQLGDTNPNCVCLDDHRCPRHGESHETAGGEAA